MQAPRLPQLAALIRVVASGATGDCTRNKVHNNSSSSGNNNDDGDDDENNNNNTDNNND